MTCTSFSSHARDAALTGHAGRAATRSLVALALFLSIALLPPPVCAVPREVAFRSDDASILGVVDSVHSSILTLVGYPPPDVSVRGGGKRRRLIGTGIALADGRILTSASMAIAGGSVRVLLGNGVERPAVLRGVDRESNIALFQVSGATLRPLQAASPRSLAVGTWVAVVSNVAITRPQAALGRIIGRGERIDDAHGGGEIFEIDAPTYPGATGGAVLNEEGDWVAVVVGRAAPRPPDGSSVGMDRGVDSTAEPNSVLIALPVEQAGWIARELDTFGSVRRGFLGIQLRRAPASPSDSLGVLVASVVTGSPADSAGFRAGDRILAVEGGETHNADELTAMVRATRPGDEIEVTVLRGSEIFPIRAIVGAAFREPPLGPRPVDPDKVRRMKEDLRHLDEERQRLEQQIRAVEGDSGR